tara:strand:- start:515 stop:835 length:321 start_codon:yes stop_codon:yes gene_type:complete
LKTFTKDYNMNYKEIQERAINKAESQLSFIQIELKALESDMPCAAYTKEMIDGQISFKLKETDTWRHILDCLKAMETQRMIEEEKYIKSGMTNVELLQSLANLNAQ